MAVHETETGKKVALNRARGAGNKSLALYTESLVALLSASSTTTAFEDLVALMAQTFPLAAPALYVGLDPEELRVFSVLDAELDGHAEARSQAGSNRYDYRRVVVGGHPPVIAGRRVLSVVDQRGLKVTLLINSGKHDTIFDEWVKILAPAVSKMMDNEQLRRMAFRDGLTGVFNYRAFNDMLDAEWERAERYAGTFSVIMLDVDWFKKINDNFGHQVGDEVLEAVAGILKQSCRRSDLVFRYGGEEVAILMPNTGLDKAGMMAERIRQRVCGIVFDGDLNVSVSLGVSQYSQGLDAREIVRNADKSLYKAKKNGRNRVEVFEVIL